MYTEVCFTPISYSLKKKLFRQEKRKKKGGVGEGCTGVAGTELIYFVVRVSVDFATRATRLFYLITFENQP